MAFLINGTEAIASCFFSKEAAFELKELQQLDFTFLFNWELVQGRESVCCGVLGIPLLENEKGLRCLGFLVSRILEFLVSWFQSFLVSRCRRRFKKSFGVPYYQIPISCFLIDIGLISKIFKIILNGSSGFYGARLFQNRQIFKCFQNLEIYKNDLVENGPVFSWFV